MFPTIAVLIIGQKRDFGCKTGAAARLLNGTSLRKETFVTGKQPQDAKES